MVMVNLAAVAAYQRIYRLNRIASVQRSTATWRSWYIQSNEPGELLQWPCHDDSIINIGIAIIIIIDWIHLKYGENFGCTKMHHFCLKFWKIV